MWVAALAVALAFQVQVNVRIDTTGPDAAVAGRDSVRPPPDPATLATAFVDPGARSLLEQARAQRDSVDRTLTGYEAVVREHISVGFRALRRDRLLFRREVASRIRWHHLRPTDVEVLGAREVVPIATAREHVPDDLDSYVPHLIYDPTDDRLMSLGDGDYIRHPLAEGSEWDYRFASGDTTALQLPDGRTLRLLELKLLPRRAESRLLSGSLWLDSESHAVVQAAFRLAREFDLERDIARFDPDEADDIREIPGILKPIRADVQYLVIEYGLWEMRWWLPRIIAFEGEVQVGPLLRMPLRFERVYGDYRVEGDTIALPPVHVDLAGDSPRRSCRGRPGCVCRSGRCQRVRVTVPDDTASLLRNEWWPHSIFEQGELLVSQSDLDEVRSLLDRVPPPPAVLDPPRLYWGFDRPGLVRYNRVEGLSLGARAELEYGRYAADLTARIGVADLEPNVELGIGREALGQKLRLTGYHRLAAVDERARPFSIGNSLDALVLGRDNGDYYRALGIELIGRGPIAGSLDYDWRLFVERQSAARAETDFSLRGLVDDDLRFRADLPVQDAELAGGEARLRLTRGLDPEGFRWSADLSGAAATGTFRYARSGLGLALAFPLPGPLIGSIEGAAGTSWGTLPIQAQWFLGGAHTLRGYDPITTRGEAFWRGRAEIATAFPGARLALFSDLGWAGRRNEFGRGAPLQSAGLGASLLDGLLRLDLARALREPTGWKLHFHLDAPL